MKKKTIYLILGVMAVAIGSMLRIECHRQEHWVMKSFL